MIYGDLGRGQEEEWGQNDIPLLVTSTWSEVTVLDTVSVL